MNCWRARWCYVDSNGNRLSQFSEQVGDFLASPLPIGLPNPLAVTSVIQTNFATPAGATIAVLSICSSQTPFVYTT